MRHATVTTVLDAPQEQVFDYLADVENLPRWATEFARELKRDAAGYRVVNGLGEFCFEIRADRPTGVIDMYAGADRDHMALFPTRAVSLPDGHGLQLHDVPGLRHVRRVVRRPARVAPARAREHRRGLRAMRDQDARTCPETTRDAAGAPVGDLGFM